VAKSRLRALSRRDPSDEELQAAFAHLESPDVSDMVAAILGAALVEYSLEVVVRQRFRNNDAETWMRMIESVGPLHDFHAKIITGFALGIFSEELRANLNLVRGIRNVFAHSKAYLRFDHPDLGNALAAAQPIKSGKKQLNVGTLALGSGKRAYLDLCFSLFLFF
jgi:hypothetical protein